MPERKSNRARKTVDYTKFGGGDDLDDDFADSTPPLSKRPKLANKENVEKKADKKLARKEPKKRNNVEEKMFELELQAALELSMSQSEPSQEADVKVTPEPSQESEIKVMPEPSPEADVKVMPEPSVLPGASSSTEDGPPNIVDNDTDNRAPSPILPKIENPPVLAKVRDIDSDIEVIEENVDEVPSRRRAPKPKKYIDSDTDSEEPDSDFAPGGGDNSDDSDDDDDDNGDDDDDDYNGDDSDDDFGVPKKKGKKASTSTPKPAVKPKQVATKTTKTTAPKPAGAKPAATKPVKPSTVKPSAVKPSTVKPSIVKAVPKPVVSRSPAVSSPVARSSAAGLTRKTPNWTPPATSGPGKSPLAGVSLKSPSTGIRLGLSRNMKLKPLHPNLKMPN